MDRRIEDYGLISDAQSAALVRRDGSIDWACFPRFDSGACFAALLGGPDNGRWRLAPVEPPRETRRRYRDGTLVLETEVDVDGGTARVIDFMPPRGVAPDIVRIVEGVRGRVEFEVELVIRFDYGAVLPWVRRDDHALNAVAGADALCLRSDVEVSGKDMTTVGRFSVTAGDRRFFTLTWYPSHQDLPPALDAGAELDATERWWRDWSERSTYDGPWSDAVDVSLRVLKALTYQPTGGVVAAPTTSLPERPGGMRNWDYRFCWLRDATLTLYAMLLGGYRDEAAAWREWLLRAVAGDPASLQIMYGVAGERRLPEYELPHLAGFDGARPVRVGNAASAQLQLDVYGEVIDMLYQARRAGVGPSGWSWSLEKALLDFLESHWSEPDDGIWEVRGGRRNFTHSKVMAWVAFDRAVKTVETMGLEGPVERWRRARDAIHTEVCERGFDGRRNTFTQSYGSAALDASLLLLPAVGFLPARDPRVLGTIAAVERELVRDGFVLRYAPDGSGSVDGLPPGEGAFLPCTFWLADAYALAGRQREAEAVFERALAVRNDLGLLAEEYDPAGRRLLGNFPQAFSHLALVGSAFNLSHRHRGPSQRRCDHFGLALPSTNT